MRERERGGGVREGEREKEKKNHTDLHLVSCFEAVGENDAYVIYCFN